MKTKLIATPFTPALTRAFKSHRARLFCSVTDGAAYVTNGQILVKLTPEEYDEFIRPISQRDPGAWVLDEDGQPMERETLDGSNVLQDFASKATADMVPAPFTLNPEAKKQPAFSAYYGAAGDFVFAFDVGYTAIVSPSSVTFRARSTTSGMVAFSGDDPVALILPVRLKNPQTLSAVRAYFTEPQPKTDAAAELEQLRAQLTESTNERGRLQAECDSLRAQLEAAQAPKPKTDPQPGDNLEAVISSLQALPGISATVKGARTASPVVWIDGDAEPHKAELEKLGAKWSFKRSAYYVQIKAA